MDSSANKVTFARIFLAPLYIVILLLPIPNKEVYATILFVVAASSDGLDGYLARKNREVTTFGKFLDPLADKLLISAALITLTWLKLVNPLAVFAVISREFAVTGLRVIAASQGQVIAASKLGKVKTFTQVIAITGITLNAGLTPGDSWYNELLKILPFNYIVQAAWILAIVMTIISGIDYFLKNKHVFKKGLA